ASGSAIRLGKEAEGGPAQQQGEEIGADVRALEVDLRTGSVAEMEPHIAGPDPRPARGAQAPDAQLGAAALRLHLDAAGKDLVGKGEDEEEPEGDHRRSGQEQLAQHRPLGEERFEIQFHQDPCQALTLSETSSRSLLSNDLRSRRRRTLTTPGLRSRSESSRTSLSSGTLPRFTSTVISLGRPFCPPATTPRSLIPPTSTPAFLAAVSTKLISAGGLWRSRASSICRSCSCWPYPAERRETFSKSSRFSSSAASAR